MNRQRAFDRQNFLDSLEWGGAEQVLLAGDASPRTYFRLARNGETAILMDSPRGGPDDPGQFLFVANHLQRLGVSAPKCIGQNLEQGFLLLEDFGDGVFSLLMKNDQELEVPLYFAAVDVLIAVQTGPKLNGLPDLSAKDWAEAAMLVATKYMQRDISSETLQKVIFDAICSYADGPRVVILRDYHAENLMYLPNRTGVAAVGVLDFQLAQMGQPGYDLVSLLQDARREVSMAVESEVKKYFVEKQRLDPISFESSYAVLGVQRALRIMGIFAKLAVDDGKPQYLQYLPRVFQYLHRNLEHPSLGELKSVCANVIPAPDAEQIDRLRSKCRTSL